MDVRGNTVKLNDGTQISYDKCLIATGKLVFILFVICLVPGFFIQWYLSDKKIPAFSAHTEGVPCYKPREQSKLIVWKAQYTLKVALHCLDCQ